MKTGTLVNYWRGLKSGEPSGSGKVTDSGDMYGTAVVWIEGCEGCINITHVEEIKTEKKT